MKRYRAMGLAGLATALTSNVCLAHEDPARLHLHLIDGVINPLLLLAIPLMLATGWVLKRRRAKRCNGRL
jgi:hypothetical protein